MHNLLYTEPPTKHPQKNYNCLKPPQASNDNLVLLKTSFRYSFFSFEIFPVHKNVY